MNSHFINFGKQLLVLTLIAGFLAMPVAPILVLAEESSAPVEPALVVVDIVAEPSSAPAAPAVTDVVVPEVTVVAEPAVNVATDTCPIIISPSSTSTEASTSSEELIVPAVDNSTIDLPIQKEVTLDPVGEDSFTTEKEQSPLDDSLVPGSESSFTTLAGDIDTPDNLAISEENPFGNDEIIVTPDLSSEGEWETLANDIVVDDLAISGEGNFTTTKSPDDDKELVVSAENSFVTATLPDEDKLVVSDEQSFITLDIPTDDHLTVSDENSFTTLPGGDDSDPAISDEGSFTTLGDPNNPDLTISDEMSFTTLGGSGDPDSDEYSFTTESGPGPSGCVGSCGGYSSGGGSVLAAQTYRCETLLYKFIKYGATNDRREVIKLQAFLKVYEGFNNLKITGTYDLPTYQAVEIFQKRYGKDVLGPWKISDSTGYVYITTRIAINNIFCGRDTTNNTDLRDKFYREYEAATGEAFPSVITSGNASSTLGGYYLTPTTTEATGTAVVKKSWILASLSGLFNFAGNNLCWLLNLFLLLIILFLLWLLWSNGRDEETLVPTGTGDIAVDELGLPADKLGENYDVFNEPIVNSSLGMVGAVALEEIMTEDDHLALADLAEEEDSQIPAANNDPDQEKLLEQ